MIALAIDTSTEAQVLGLRVEAEDYERFEIAGRVHSRIILPSILALLQDAGITRKDLDVIVFGRGPGSFTGLRIAVGVVQGLAYGLDIPVVPVSTLACLAQGEYRRSGATDIVVAQVARRDEVFFGSYCVRAGLAQRVGNEGVFDAASVPTQPFTACVGIGSGWRLKEKLEVALGAHATDIVLDVHPHGRDLLDLGMSGFEAGAAVAALEARPEYLRERVATLPGDSH